MWHAASNRRFPTVICTAGSRRPLCAQEIANGGVHIRTNDQGAPSGECYVVFASEEALTGALEIKRKVMGHRFVTVERADAAVHVRDLTAVLDLL